MPNTTPAPHAPTANERLKRGWERTLWSSLSLAVIAHFAIFTLWPEMAIADVSYDADEIITMDIPDEVELPPEPEQIRRPATPVVGAATIDEDITIESNSFDDWEPADLLRPPTGSGSADSSGADAFTAWEVPPSIRNVRELARALEREYPATLRDSGIGGTVRVWFQIDQEGRVIDRRVEESSGYTQFDEAALAVADILVFNPAQNRDRNVAVAVVFPIVFRVR